MSAEYVAPLKRTVRFQLRLGLPDNLELVNVSHLESPTLAIGISVGLTWSAWPRYARFYQLVQTSRIARFKGASDVRVDCYMRI